MHLTSTQSHLSLSLSFLPFTPPFPRPQGNDGNIRKFTIYGDKNVKVFPRAHTCFNRIDMPIYKSKVYYTILHTTIYSTVLQYRSEAKGLLIPA
jgi:hypothetical protein